MRRIIHYIILMFLSFSISCGGESIQKNSSEYVVQNYEYDQLTIPVFFSALIANHLQGFYQLGKDEYSEFCLSHNLDANDSQNLNNYFTLSILHKLFTSQTAADYSRGEILYIPYLWHWVNPNPRHELYFIENDILLSNQSPPSNFANYQTYADIDRTPYLFLSDLVLEQPKYYSDRGGTFYSFGWCSEREMAFIALISLLNYEGKIVATGNHSWSELLIPMIKDDGSKQHFSVTVDNTFNVLK